MSLEKIADEINNCTKCELHEERTKTVPGEGDPEAEILFIGEGPGKNEDEQGRPFVGAAGKYLEELLGMIGLTRKDVYIANVVKCRPPGNRDPLPEEVETCTSNYLFRQIDLINPAVIVTLGRHSMDRFVPDKRISQDHGKPVRVKGQVYYPVYHPAAALYRGSLRGDIEADFLKLPKVVEKVKEETEKFVDINKAAEDKQKQQSLL
ncbi:uracil-DNA glycosylase family protein [Patescibacteria group bacterium]